MTHDAVWKHLKPITEELKEMHRLKLFTPEEIRAILKRRREFAYNIYANTEDGITNEVESFAQYTSYEENLLKDLHLRRDNYHIADKREIIDDRIITRIKALYGFGILRFSDIPLFMSFLKFCKSINEVNQAADAVRHMIREHSDEAQIWVAVARWHAYDRMDIRVAMLMLKKGIVQSNDSRILYKEMVLIKFLERDRNVALLEENSSYHDAACVQKLENIVFKILEEIKDVEFYVEILELLDSRQFTVKVQDIIIRCLIKDYLDNANVWHILAQRERKGITDAVFYHDLDGSMAEDEGNESVESSLRKARTPKARLDACLAKYREGIAEVSEANKPKLLSLYLDFLRKLDREHGEDTGETLYGVDALN